MPYLDEKYAHLAYNNVMRILKREMARGLIASEIKPKTKIYEELLDAMNAPRVSFGLRPLAAAAKDNYMTRIRKFVRSRGEEELDLFGNLARKALSTKAITITLDPEVSKYFPNSESVNSALLSLIKISLTIKRQSN